MKLFVDRLKQTPAELAFGPDDPGWAEVLESVPELRGALAEPPSVTLRAHRMGQDAYLEGVLTGALELECSRCLVRYRSPLREPFRLVLEPAGGRVPAEPEAARDLARLGMCLGDELELGWFEGPAIDLRSLLREVVALAVPVQPLCREDCRGLCPRCGVDRNRETCGCEAERPASPFAALAALRRRQEP
ncbi:MAG: DUF177 domain-containing protein [Deltaproteobacteria bacterium]|nr:DUF177 domain-containing protein [Deltaproteobacteria bacterium]